MAKKYFRFCKFFVATYASPVNRADYQNESDEVTKKDIMKVQDVVKSLSRAGVVKSLSRAGFVSDFVTEHKDEEGCHILVTLCGVLPLSVETQKKLDLLLKQVIQDNTVEEFRQMAEAFPKPDRLAAVNAVMKRIKTAIKADEFGYKS